MVQRYRKARAELKKYHNERWLTEERARASRTPRGIRGLWGWITRKNRKARKINEAEIAQAKAPFTIIERKAGASIDHPTCK